MKENEELADEQEAPIFEVRRSRTATIYEASKNVDWMSMFPDEPGNQSPPDEPGIQSPKLIDLPVEPLVPTPANAPPDRPMVPYYPQVRERGPWLVIAALAIAVLGTSAFLYWVLKPPAVQRANQPEDRLTIDALAPAAPRESPEATPSPRPEPANTLPAETTRAETTRTPAPRTTTARTKPAPSPTPASRSGSTSSFWAERTPAVRAEPSPTPRATPTATQAAAAPPPALTVAASASTVTSAGSAPPSTVSLSDPPPRTAPKPEPSMTPVSSPPPSPSPLSSLTPTPSPSPSPTSASASAARNSAAETKAIRAVLDSYRAAYESLRAESVKAVWPGANSQALSRAFSQIAAQNMDFYSCGIELNAGGAEATCTGAVTFVPKVGGKTPQVEPRNWSFFLVRQGERWVIDRVVAR